MSKLWAAFVLGIVAIAILVWAGDQVTLQGERTVFAVTCEGGAWDGLHCTGRLAPGDRHRFRSSRSRNEVIYWIAGSRAPSGKFTDCQVQSRDNWTCNAQIGQPPSITHELSRGKPRSLVAGLDAPFHAVAKWKWWMLRWGIAWFTDADFSNELPARPPAPDR